MQFKFLREKINRLITIRAFAEIEKREKFYKFFEGGAYEIK